MRLTCELGEEASRNVFNAKHPRKCLYTVSQFSEVMTLCSEMTGKLPRVKLLPQSLTEACFLPACPGGSVVARLHVLVAAGMFGPAGLIGQSVPKPLQSLQTKPGRDGMYQTKVLTVIVTISDENSATATKTVDVARILVVQTQSHKLFFKVCLNFGSQNYFRDLFFFFQSKLWIKYEPIQCFLQPSKVDGFDPACCCC